MKNYIPRPLYLKRIEPFIDKALIKVITGQRRIGKSYIGLRACITRWRIKSAFWRNGTVYATYGIHA